MEMNVNTEVLKKYRAKNNWTQQHLADLCSVSLRTIQRIEKSGVASIETVAALSSVFEVDKAEFVIVSKEKMISTKGFKDYRTAVYILLIAQFIGLFGLFYSRASLTESQFQIATIVVCAATLFSFIILGISAYKKGVIKLNSQSSRNS